MGPFVYLIKALNMNSLSLNLVNITTKWPFPKDNFIIYYITAYSKQEVLLTTVEDEVTNPLHI